MIDPTQLANSMCAELCRRSFREFVLRLRPGYKFNWHHEVLIAALQRLGDREIKQLIVSMPPRHGKSELVSRLFPAWLLCRNGDEQIIACSYAASLANAMSRDCQRVINSETYRKYFPDTRLSDGTDIGFTRSAQRFDVVGRQGYYMSAGVGGGITGAGATVGIIDDPVKDAAEADSAVVRDNIWEWYTSTFLSRQEMNYIEVILATRWNEDDLTGRVLKQEDEEGGRVIICLPAIAEQDEEYREAGEPLWNDKYNLDRLHKIKTRVGTKQWTALYQQRPSPAEGNIFKKSWFGRYNKAELNLNELAVKFYADTAYTDQEKNDPCAFLAYVTHNSNYYILKCVSKHLNFPDQMKYLQEFASANGYSSKSIIRVEPKATGKSLVQSVRKYTSLSIAEAKVPSTSKVARANQVSPICESGRVFVPFGEAWVDDFLEQVSVFPNAKNDDEVDCLSGMIINDGGSKVMSSGET